jgi:hypothetical protein
MSTPLPPHSYNNIMALMSYELELVQFHCSETQQNETINNPETNNPESRIFFKEINKKTLL